MKNKGFEAWAMPILKKYQKILLLEDFCLTFEYKKTLKHEGTLMQSVFMYPYKKMRLQYSDFALESWKERDKEGLKRTLVHELCHSITDPLYNVGYDRFTTKDTVESERERLTDHIANMILKLIE